MQSIDKKRILWSLGFAIVIIAVVLFMFYEVSTMPDDAQQCLSSPMTYAEERLTEREGYDVVCSCEKATAKFPQINIIKL
jgi:hypothetical protein